MLPEVYFLRYAFPCARVLVDFRKSISEEEYEQMKEAVDNDTPMPRDYLEKVFHKAIEGMKRIDSDFWNIKTIKKYFCEGHEAMLSKDLPQTVKRLCVVKPGKLVKEFKGFFRVDLGEGDVRIVAPLYKDAKVGDTAMIHYGYAVEKV
ncbi:hypothetical protein KY349_01885 [Candidatus Woesearchaeota archaeon]|jgi:hypothetical protein|nr:hypothetical protein [Candidatus Woesearchaeota archaeon]